MTCGDGVRNTAAGEQCDGVDNDLCPSRCGAPGTPSACQCPSPACGQEENASECALAGQGLACCGNGTLDAGEACDTVAQSATCDHDCSLPVCGDLQVNAAAGEDCDEDPSLGRCVGCRLAPCPGDGECLFLPAADTRIETGEEQTLDHGLEIEIEADSEGRGIAYLKFDLTGLRGRISRAVLELVCTDSSESWPPEAGTIFPVRDASWLEGNRDAGDDEQAPESWSSCGPGLKWIDVDADGDGAVGGNERSRYTPDLTQPIVDLDRCLVGQKTTADVTAAFQSGAGVYSLAIATNDTDSVKYASREHPNPEWRPVLRVVLGGCGDGETDAGEECDDGNRTDGDGCDGNCTVSRCGNGVVAGAEECDDGNVADGDCCSAGCVLQCCGNRTIDTGENCDDGNRDDADGCNARCRAEDCCREHASPGCGGTGFAASCQSCVCGIDPVCCSVVWDERCALEAQTNCVGACLCGECRPAPGVTCRLKPVGDTYVEGPTFTDTSANNDCPACGEATWDHGSRDRFDIDGDPRGLAYLRFNLEAIAAAQLGVKTATLSLFSVNNPSVSGVDVYRLADSAWVEGNCGGIDISCAVSCDSNVMTCPLRFVDVDTNDDGVVDAGDSHRFLPTFASGPVNGLMQVTEGESRVDVTPAFADAAGSYSLVIDQRPHPTAVIYGDGATFASREFFDETKHPVLEVRLACTRDDQCPRAQQSCTRAICSSGDCGREDLTDCKPCSTDESCDDQNPCTTERCGDPEEGCIVAAIPSSFAAATCALVGYQPSPDCDQATAVVDNLDGAKAKVCTRLKQACERQFRRDRQAQRARQRALRKAKRSLTRAQTQVVRANTRRRVSDQCAQLLLDRIELALEQLRAFEDDPALVCGGTERVCPSAD